MSTTAVVSIHSILRLLVVLGLLAILGVTLRHTQGERAYQTDPVSMTVVRPLSLSEFRKDDGMTTHQREVYVPYNFIGTHLRTSEYLSDPSSFGY